ncbi:nesp011 [Neophasia sp. alphabaculovirus]|nr:nesp011 [Neophasia sp. alphabaculovirus]
MPEALQLLQTLVTQFAVVYKCTFHDKAGNKAIKHLLNSYYFLSEELHEWTPCPIFPILIYYIMWINVYVNIININKYILFYF